MYICNKHIDCQKLNLLCGVFIEKENCYYTERQKKHHFFRATLIKI